MYVAATLVAASLNVLLVDAQRYNRVFGPMIGKRTQDAGDFKGEEVFDFNVPDDSQTTDTDQFDFRQPSTSCPLDSLFMQLTPEWQQMILKMMRRASYKS
ncbi:uncharacterized protein [Diadema setosum]|uniref:uncharacterized protein isoform X2 n=1 Tax=Diadema setosum TaxID=31175 RepID=UPI003B3BABF6